MTHKGVYVNIAIKKFIFMSMAYALFVKSSSFPFFIILMVSLLWPLNLFPLSVKVLEMSLGEDAQFGTEIFDEIQYHGLFSLILLTINFFFIAHLWLTVEDRTGVPPGIRFLACFYKHPGHEHVNRATDHEDAPTFDAGAFQEDTERDLSKWARRLQTEAFLAMRAKVDAAAERFSAEETKLAERERRRAEAEEAERKEEQADVEAELEVLRAAEELEKAKARLEERRRRQEDS